MSDVYENCPAFENDKFLLRFSQLDDAEDLVSVYSDKNALPFFNSVILSILVYTLFSRMFDLMQPPVVKHSIAVA